MNVISIKDKEKDMASVNGILTCLKNIDSKKDSLQKAILTLAVEWRDLDKQLDSTRSCIDACVVDLELKQKDLECNQESVAKSSRELDEVQKSLGLKFEELERREEKFRCFHQSQVEELGLKQKFIEDRMRECEMREEKLLVQKKSMEVCYQKIEKEKVEFEANKKSVGEKLKELDSKERNYDNLCKEVNSIQDRMETWAKELGSKEEQLKELQKLNEERKNELLDIVVKECALREEKLNMEKKSIEVEVEKFEMEKQEVEDRKKSVDEMLNEVSLKERNCESMLREVNLIQDWTEMRSRELYTKEEEFSSKEEQLNAREKMNAELREELDVIAREYKLKETKLEMEKEEFQNIQKDVDKKWKEICLKEKNYEDRCEEVKLLQGQLEKRAKDLDTREKHVALREEELQKLQKKNREYCENLISVEKECRVKEEKLSVEKKSMEEKSEKNQKEREQFESLKKSLTEKLNEVGSKERNLEHRSKELNAIQDWIERRARELDSKEEQIASREGQLKSKLNKEPCEKIGIVVPECKLKNKKVNKERGSLEVLLQKIEKETRQFEDSKRSVDDQLIEISVKEKNCQHLSEEVNLILDRIEMRAREFGSKEEQFILSKEQLKAVKNLNKQRCEELLIIVQECKFIEEMLNVANKSMEVLLKVVEKEKETDDITLDCNSKDDILRVAIRSLEVLLEKVEKLKEDFEGIRETLGTKLNEISLKERNYDDMSKEVKLILDIIEKQAIELDSKVENLPMTEEQLQPMLTMNAERNQELDMVDLEWKEKQLDSVQKHINRCFNDIHLKNKQFRADQKLFEERSKELDLNEKFLEERLRDFEPRVKHFEERFGHLEAKKKRVRGRPKRKQQFDNVKADQVKEISTMGLSAGIQDLVTVDGKSLQLYVCENHKYDTPAFKEVCEKLNSSSDFAKLVIEAMEGFYPPHLKREDFEFETGVVRKSCILLLEKVMVLSPEIGPHVKEAALRLANEWKMKMEVHKDTLEVLGFIQLLASYKLASGFDADQLLEYFEFFAMRKLASDLLRALDLSERVPDLILRLINNNKHWVAVKFIVEFELAEEFPPVPILRDYMRVSKRLIKDKRYGDNNTAEELDNENDEIIACMRNITNCIKLYKLECGKWKNQLHKGIHRLTEQRSKKCTEPTVVVKKTLQQKNDDNNFVPYRMSKKGFSYFFVDMDGNNLLLFLNKHIDEHSLLQKEVSAALKMSYDSAATVLDAIQVYYTSYLIKGDSNIEASVVLLLEELMIIKPDIKPQVKERAKDIAVEWKSITEKLTIPGLTLGFLLFVAAYGLTSSFGSHELLKLCQTIGKYKLAPELFRALGFTEEIPVSNNVDQSAPEDLELSNTVTTTLGTTPRSNWDRVPNTVRFALDPAQLALDAVEACYYSMLNNRKISKVEVMKSFNFLLTRLLRVPLEVKPHIMEQAKKFAADWKEKLKRSNSLEVTCLVLLLATYKVLSSFPTADLLSLLEIVYDDRAETSLFQLLRLSDEVPDFIRRLVDGGEHLSAIKYTYAFGLVNEFSPFPLLENYIKAAKEEAQKIRERGQDSPDAREMATKLKLEAFKAVMNCVRFHRLESDYPLQNLKSQIGQMEKQVSDLKNTDKKRKRSKGFSGEPWKSKKLRKGGPLSKQRMPNCSENSIHPSQSFTPAQPVEYPVELPAYARSPTGNYCSEAMPTPMGPNYNAGPVPYWRPMGPPPNSYW